mmetsp:Transcript_45579/g.132686  ORF Transcript_45579/g.132686 Transcript_45579/m.132686 type:complete len:310 (-) Transcript_45579:681-1610(-)
MSMLACMSRSSGEGRMREPAPQLCKAAIKRPSVTLPSFMTSMRSKMSATTTPAWKRCVLDDRFRLRDSFASMRSRRLSTSAKPSSFKSPDLSDTWTRLKVSVTWPVCCTQRVLMSSKAQAGAKCWIPATNCPIVSWPSRQVSIKLNKVLISASFNSKGKSNSWKRSKGNFAAMFSISPVSGSAKLSSKVSVMLRKHRRIFNLRSSRKSDGSVIPMALTNSLFVISPSESTSIKRYAFFASSSEKPKRRTALRTNSAMSTVPPRSMSKSVYAFSMLPLYTVMSLWRTSSRRRSGDTVAIAAISSSNETFP